MILTGPDGKDRYTLTAAERDKKIEAGSFKLRVEGADGFSHSASSGKKAYRSSFISGLHDECVVFEKGRE